MRFAVDLLRGGLCAVELIEDRIIARTTEAPGCTQLWIIRYSVPIPKSVKTIIRASNSLGGVEKEFLVLPTLALAECICWALAIAFSIPTLCIPIVGTIFDCKATTGRCCR